MHLPGRRPRRLGWRFRATSLRLEEHVRLLEELDCQHVLALFGAVLCVAAWTPFFRIKLVGVLAAYDRGTAIIMECHRVGEHQIHSRLQALFVLRSFQRSSRAHDGLFEAVVLGRFEVHTIPSS